MSNFLYVAKYIPIKSLIHTLDPRVKLTLSAMMMVWVFMADTWWGWGLLTLFLFSVVKFSQLPWETLSPGIVSFRWILILTATAQLLIYQDPAPWFNLGPIHLGVLSMGAAAFLLARLILILLIAQLLLISTSTVQMTTALEMLFRPLQKLHFPTGELVMIITIALHFLPLILEESIMVRTAQIARGADFSSGNIKERLKKQLMIIVPVFNLALQRSEDLAESLESRAYVPGSSRSHLYPLKMRSSDYLGLGLMFLLGGVLWFFSL